MSARTQKLPDLADLTGDPFGPPMEEINQAPDPVSDVGAAEAALQRRILALDAAQLPIEERWVGERKLLEELHGPEAAQAMLEERGRETLWTASTEHIAGASRQDYQQARESNAAAQRQAAEALAKFQRMYPEFAGRSVVEVERAAEAAIAEAQHINHLDPHAYVSSDEFYHDVSLHLELNEGGAERPEDAASSARIQQMLNSGDNGRDNVSGGYGRAMPAPSGGGGDMLADIQGWQRRNGLV